LKSLLFLKQKELLFPFLKRRGTIISGDHGPPWYAWFIKRNHQGIRTHHIHIVEPSFEHWDRLLFRDYLIEHPAFMAEYEAIKKHLARQYPNDRIAYTKGKTEFIEAMTEAAKKYYR
jgi:GrpB-like predicted nucleotidyltransferase (UPF0157 family)